MHAHTNKTQENKSQSTTKTISQKYSGGSVFQFVDNRPEAVTHKQLNKIVDNGSQTTQVAQLHAIIDNYSSHQQDPIQKQTNNTGLPDHLKSGIEDLSGYSMDDVKVHYNSDKPAQLQAHAYAQGNEIHLAQGQEKHLPHEAWHVVQQKQGRVQPTMQLKAGSSLNRGKVDVNNDDALEKEADIMGAKAASGQLNQTLQLKTGQVNLSKGVVQGYFETHEEQYQSQDEIDENWGAFLNKATEDILGGSLGNEIYNELVDWAESDEDWGSNWSESGLVFHLYDQIKARVSEDPEFEAGSHTDAMMHFRNLIGKKSASQYTAWIPAMHEMEYYMSDLRQSLDDDEEIQTLNAYSSKLYELKKQIMELKGNIDNAGKQDYDLKVQMGQFMYAASEEIIKLFNNLRKEFPMHSGGFSAKGRAHAITTSAMGLDKYTKDDNYLKNITLDGDALGQTSIYKEQLNVSETAAQPSAPKALGSLVGEKGEGAGLAAYEKALNKTVDTPQNVKYTTTPVSKDRNGGQGVNMLNTNASAYAMMSGVPNWKSKKWEWLHVRAASLGGATDGTNLVVGTRDANTHMMPFEANIRALGGLVKNNDNYTSLDVSFSANHQYKEAKHRFNEIKITWALNKSDMADDESKDLSGEAIFSPLSTASSISKDEIGIIESALKDKRDGLDD